MDSTDDDFGELYVDAKVQASDTFAGDVGGFVKSCKESECATNSRKDKVFTETVKPVSEGEMKKLGLVAKDSSLCVDACAVNNPTEANEEDSGYSDSDDDLNIVLKDDDSNPLPVARGSNTNSGVADDAVQASKTCYYQRRTTRNWCTMLNGRMTMDASANKACIDPSLGISQCGSSFSHTWSRSAFDVNFDELEKKPWRNPAMDSSDYFNFGFNEQTWKDYCKPLGRAIEVAGGTFGRIPSAELRRPRDSDPDVVIQIPVTNDVEELSSMTPVKARSLSIESSRSEDSHSNDGKDLDLFDDSVKDEAFVGCQDEKTGSFIGEQSPPTENCCSREVTPCDNDMIEKEKEEIFCSSDEADPSSKERESSLGDRIRLSPASSCSVGKNEESDDYETESLKDSATDDQREASTPPRRPRLAEQEAISIKRGERSGTTNSRHRRSHEDSSKRHCGRAGYARHGSIKHRVVKDASPTPAPVCDKKVRSRYGSSYRDSNKNWQHGPLITLEENEIERKGVHYSNKEKCHGRLYSSLDHARHREHKFDWRNNKESSVDRGFGHSKDYTSRSSFYLNQRNSRSSFQEEDDRYGWHHCERTYGRERSPVRAYEYNRERNGYDWLREPYYEDCIPITDMDSRYQSEYSFAHERHNLRQSPEKNLHCRRREDYDYNLHRHRYGDTCHREESIISYKLAYREMHYFPEMGRREYQGYESHEEFSEIDKRHHHSHDWHLDRFVSEKDGRKYRTQDAWPSPSWSLRDSKHRRDVRTAEAYDSQNNRLYKAAPRDDWTQNLGRSNNVSIRDRRLKDGDDWVRPDGGLYKLAQCSRREVTHSENPSYTDEILVRDRRIPAHNRISTKQRSRNFKSHIYETDERHDGSKKVRGNGHAFNKCQDPVATVMSRGKLSNQSKKGFSNGEDTIEQQDGQTPRKVLCRSEEKAVQIQVLNDKEEGEIIEWNVRGVEIDNERIQESLKKMEKRRERFKETKLARRAEATFESQTEPRAKTDATDQQRPVRKRRWCAS